MKISLLPSCFMIALLNVHKRFELTEMKGLGMWYSMSLPLNLVCSTKQMGKRVSKCLRQRRVREKD